MKAVVVLKSIINKVGPLVYDKAFSERFTSLLSDYNLEPNQAKLLKLAYDDGIPAKLLYRSSADNVAKEICLKNLTGKFSKDNFLDEVQSELVVSVFAYAIGWKEIEISSFLSLEYSYCEKTNFDFYNPFLRTPAAQKVFDSIQWEDIPAGTFMMGSPETEEYRSENEHQHEVTLSAFKMGAHTITFEQYDSFCEDIGIEKPHDESWGRNNRPVINVSWQDAVLFADWLGEGVRIPTEVEWEYAFRAGTTTAFHTGENLTNLQACCLSDNIYKSNTEEELAAKTMPVGSFLPNTWGIYDMHGNVVEFCCDWMDNYYLPAIDPKGPNSGDFRVCRGGYFFLEAWGCRSACRSTVSPERKYRYAGFRVVFSE